MPCSFCGSQIPPSQPLCPVCYSSVGTALSAEGPRQRWDFVAFMLDDESSLDKRAEWYHERVLKDLCDDLDSTCCHWTEEQFANNPTRTFHRGVLITNSMTVEEQAEQLAHFMREHPHFVAGIEYSHLDTIPAVSPLPNTVMFVKPGDVDSWLTVMNTLLSLSRNRHEADDE